MGRWKVVVRRTLRAFLEFTWRGVGQIFVVDEREQPMGNRSVRL